MRIKVERRRICIEPYNETDEAYIEEVLGLKHEGDTAIYIFRAGNTYNVLI